MKKIMTIILSISLLLCGSVNVFAAEESGSTMEVPVSYNIQSNYSIYIPEMIDFSDNMSYTFSAASINVMDGEVVAIYDNASYGKQAQEGITLTNESGKTGELYINHNDPSGKGRVAVFDNNNLQSSISFNGYFDGTSAGYYTGTMTFLIFVESAN